MAEIDITAVIFLISFFLIFGIFLLYDLFRKGQNYGYFAYFVACLPANYLWALSSSIENVDVLTAYLVLFLLWDACLIRDFFFTVKDEKNHMATLLFLSIGVLVQLIVTTILPAETLGGLALQENCEKMLFFWFPDVYTVDFAVEAWVNSSILLGFRISVTVMVLLALIPLVIYLKTSGEQGLMDLVFITAIFILPFIYLGYVWFAQSWGVLTFLFSVILLIVLLLLTKGDK